MQTVPHVLVVDNDRSIRELLRMVLERSGVAALLADSPSEAEAQLLDADIRLLVLDLHLSAGQTGHDLVADWRERHLLRPFLMLTGRPLDPRVVALERDPLCRGIWGKPFDILAFGRRVRELAEEESWAN